MRSRTVWGTVLTIVGVICLAAAAVLAWVVVPGKAKLPADLDVTRQYVGVAGVLLNPQAIASGTLTGAVVVDTPVTVQRTVKALATDGNAAEVSDDRTLQNASGQTLGATSTVYAVDRTSLEQASQHPASWAVTPQQGLTVSFPIGTKKQDYTGWVSDTRTTTTLHYARTEEKAGINAYVFTADTGTNQIKDPQVLATLPQALPVSRLLALATALPIPPDLRAQLTAALPQSTQPIPLVYTYQAVSTYWVEPTTGTVVDVAREEIRKAGPGLPNASTVAAVIPIYDVATQGTPPSVAQAASDAQDSSSSLRLWGTTGPLLLLAFGLVILVGGVVLMWASRREKARTSSPSSRR